MKNKITIKKSIINLICAIICQAVLFSSCSNDSTDIVKEYDTAEEAAQICGITPMGFVPSGFEASAYRTVYDFAFETEYMRKQDDDTVTAILRVAGAEYDAANFSGVTDTTESEQYTAKNGKRIEIRSNSDNRVYAAEWLGDYGGRICKISFVIFGSDSNEYKDKLEELLAVIDE